MNAKMFSIPIPNWLSPTESNAIDMLPATDSLTQPSPVALKTDELLLTQRTDNFRRIIIARPGKKERVSLVNKNDSFLRSGFNTATYAYNSHVYCLTGCAPFERKITKSPGPIVVRPTEEDY